MIQFAFKNPFSEFSKSSSLPLSLSFFFTLMSFYFFLKNFHTRSIIHFFIDSTTQKKINITFNSISQKQLLLTLMYLLHFSRLSPFLLLKNTRKMCPVFDLPTRSGFEFCNAKFDSYHQYRCLRYASNFGFGNEYLDFFPPHFHGFIIGSLPGLTKKATSLGILFGCE